MTAGEGGGGAARDPQDGAGKAEQESPVEPLDLSGFLSRILEQLSITSWLPAAMLTANASLLLLFRKQGRVDVTAAVATLTSQPWGLLIGWLLLLVLVATVTQAFERQAIFALEGDWPTTGPIGVARRGLVTWQRARRRKLTDELGATHRAIVDQVLTHPDNARTSRFADDDRREVLDLLVSGRSPFGQDDDLIVEIHALNWQERCDPHALAHLDRIRRALEEFPAAERILPTKLGTLLAVVYDRLEAGKMDRDVFVLRRDELPAALVASHDSARGHLNMYATLVFAFVGLAVATPFALWPDETRSASTVPVSDMLVLTTTYLALAWLCYTAAVRAGRFFSRSLLMALRHLPD